MERQMNQNNTINFENEQSWNLEVPEIKTYKHIVIKTVLYWQKKRHFD